MVTQTTRFILVLLLNLSMIVGLVTIGISSHSLGVLAAGGDFIADSAAIVLGLIAIHIHQKSHGFSKATTIVALINATFLLIVTLFVVFQALLRLIGHTPVIEAFPVLLISAISALIMLIGVFILRGKDSKNDLHMRSVMLDTISDAASAMAVSVTGGIMFITKNFYWLDSLVALIIGLIIGYQALSLLKDVMKKLQGK